MARDHALAQCLGEGEGVLRFYRWAPATVSFGRNEPARGRYSRELAKEAGVSFVRRPTGGRSVLHHRELTYALVFPLGALGGPKKSYRRINEGLLEGLKLLGAGVELAREGAPSLPLEAGPCFRQPAPGEVVAMGRKLIGSAQGRIGPSILQHGSIILEGKQELLGRLTADGQPDPSPATLKSLLGVVPEVEELATALQAGLAGALRGLWVHGTCREEERVAAAELEAQYLDEGWTWRR
jgi:lipoate-protein ligase A